MNIAKQRTRFSFEMAVGENSKSILTYKPSSRGEHSGIGSNRHVTLSIDLLVEWLVMIESLRIVRLRGLGHGGKTVFGSK